MEEMKYFIEICSSNSRKRQTQFIMLEDFELVFESTFCVYHNSLLLEVLSHHSTKKLWQAFTISRVNFNLLLI